MPGKQVGMSDQCYPDSLIGGIPNIYYYAANNPSEATIAKRRSYANTISYLTPPAENAGLYKGLKVGPTSSHVRGRDCTTRPQCTAQVQRVTPVWGLHWSAGCPAATSQLLSKGPGLPAPVECWTSC